MLEELCSSGGGLEEPLGLFSVGGFVLARLDFRNGPIKEDSTARVDVDGNVDPAERAKGCTVVDVVYLWVDNFGLGQFRA